MSKIIKVSTDLEVTVHDYPEGMLETQNRQLCELIGDGCDMVENAEKTLQRAGTHNHGTERKQQVREYVGG